jgi:hypothetical protein
MQKAPSRFWVATVCDNDSHVGRVPRTEAGHSLQRITIAGYPEEAAEALQQLAQDMARHLLSHHPFLSFDRLECLLIAHDFRVGLALYEADGRAYDARFMDNAETALGVVLPTQAGLVAIIHPQVMAQLQGSDLAEKHQSQRVLMHELCHVHDIGLRREWLLRRARQRHDSDWLYWRCDSLWAEYFANRYSHVEGCDESDEWRRLDVLLEHLPDVEPEYASRQLASAFGYALGTLAALNADVHDARPDMARRIRAHGLAPAWLEARTVTEELAQTGECWQCEEGVLRLATAVRLIENTCRYGRR